MIVKESTLQKKIMDTFRQHGCLVLRPIAYSEAGYPDLIVIGNGRTVFCEVKRPGFDLTKLQQFRKAQMNEHGTHVFVLTDSNQCQEVINYLKNG